MRARTLGLVAALATFACGSGIQVTTDWDPAVNFSGIETFAVLDEAQGGAGLSSFTLQRIKSAIGTAMTAKGFRQVDDPDRADIVVGFQAAMDQQSSFQTVSTGWGGGYGWRGGGWGGAGMGMSTSTTTEQVYDVGTLIIAIANAADGNMIFHSSGSKTLPSGNITPEQAQENMDNAVARILRDFPPGN
jgi:hypothetical protein